MQLLILLMCICLMHNSALSFSYEAPDNCQWKFANVVARKVSLTCSLRTLTSDFSNNAISAVHSDYTVELDVKCSDVLFFQSSLTPRIFQRLSNLETLTIEFCKLTGLPGGTFLELGHLRRLTVNTHNGDWSAMALELFRESFVGMPNLEVLDIGRNNIWNLPERVFCPLPALRELNLTWNRLQDVSEIGTVGGCGAHLVYLDMSGNDILILPDYGLAGLKSLNQLYLQYNDISMLGDEALSGLRELNVLNISSNRLAALPPDVFNQTTQLKELHLQNNSLSVLAPSLFQPLTQLKLLDLSNNQLTFEWISAETFKGMVRLIVLSLSRNQLVTVQHNMFNDLSALQILDLSYNRINFISDDTFSALANLHRLDLSANQLSTLGGRSLTGLHVLSSLYLTSNNITKIEDTTFENCTNLREIRLDANYLSSIPKAVSISTSIRSLQVSQNLIERIKSTDFTKLNNIRHVDLSQNFIRDISKDAFLGLSELEVMDLSKNEISSLSNGLFDTNTAMELLRIDGNQLKDINGLFASLPKLMWLNVSDNEISWFDYALIPEKLLYLDLRNNKLQHLGNYFEIQNQVKLRTLDVSHNELEKLTPSSIPDSIELLFVNSNKIAEIFHGTFSQKQNLTMVDLYDNLLTNIDLNSLNLSPVPDGQNLPEFYIGGNPIFCDCKMEWLHRLNQVNARRQHPRIMDLDKITCTMSYPRSGIKRVPFLESDASQFLCPYTSHCFALCKCCDFIACDCQMTCPSGCACYHDDTWATNIVECSSEGRDYPITQLPDDVPMDATIVYMDGNNMPELASHRLIGRKNLRSLFLNSSKIESIQNRTFHGLSSLKILHLEDNLITILEGFEFEHLQHLRELYLQNNKIRSINNETFLGLRAIEVIYLHDNAIFNFAVWELGFNRGLRELTLKMNTFSCDCEYVSNFKNWLIAKEDVVKDSDEIFCWTNGTNSPRVPSSILRDNFACGNFIATSIVQEKISNDYLVPVLITIGIFFIVLVLGVLFVILRPKVKKGVSKKCNLSWCSPGKAGERGDNKLYDAFISYSDTDHPFVADFFAKELENSDYCYKLCLSSREYESTGSYVGDFLITSVDCSHYVVLIITENFMSDWCKYSFKTGHLAALKGISNKIITILCNGITESVLDVDLAVLIKNSIKLRYEDKNFWKKLRSLLPKDSGSLNQPCYITEANYMVRNNMKTVPAGGQSKTNQLISNMILHSPMNQGTPMAASQQPLYLHNPKQLHHYHHLKQLGPASLLHQQPYHHHHQTTNSTSTYESGDSDRTFTTDTTMSNTTPSLNHSYMSIDYISSRNSHIYASIDDPPPGGAKKEIQQLTCPAAPPSCVQQIPRHYPITTGGAAAPMFNPQPNLTHSQFIRSGTCQLTQTIDQNIGTPSYFI